MVMIRPKNKATKIAEKVLKGKGVKVQAGDKMERAKPAQPYPQH